MSWFRYGNEALLINQWKDVETIECTRSNSTCPKSGRMVLQIYNFKQVCTNERFGLFINSIFFEICLTVFLID